MMGLFTCTLSLQVQLLTLMPTLILERHPFSWMMYSVLALKQVSFPVSHHLYIHTTVSTQTMLEFPVKVSDI